VVGVAQGWAIRICGNMDLCLRGGGFMGLLPRMYAVLIVSFFLGGCWNGGGFSLIVDEWLFRETGGTLFSNPERLTLKEIHLDNGTLVGRQVVVEGVVQEVNPVGTFLVISDQSARLLVVLTDLENAIGRLPKKQELLHVFGSIESGKKGLPFLKAVAVRSVNGGSVVGGTRSNGVGST
jgi:hypothetical protein